MEQATSSHGLVERVQQGDKEAFSLLFEKYRTRLAVIIHYRLGVSLRRDADVDDVLQETMLRAYRDIERFEYKAPGSFMSWVVRIADHVIVDAARSQNRQKRAGEHVRFRSESNPLGPEPADYHTPSRIFAENESAGRFVQTLDRLPEDYRRVILLAKVEGLTTSEVAQRLEKSNEATSLLLHRAIKRLRSLYEAHEE
ncbi:MAG TPA: sigma-70 family RNA polymerase sigma factor [Terriglobales bacterium]|nr:sigma-70 family RNA polymerase sigma factor [Terriglobales bacterium]